MCVSNILTVKNIISCKETCFSSTFHSHFVSFFACFSFSFHLYVDLVSDCQIAAFALEKRMQAIYSQDFGPEANYKN